MKAVKKPTLQEVRLLESQARALGDRYKEKVAELEEFDNYMEETYFGPAGSHDPEEVAQYFAEKAKREILDLIAET